MKKLIALLLVMMVLTTVSFAEGESASCTLNAQCFDWGEAITSITAELDAPIEATPEVTVEATVTYMDYATWSMVTEKVTREVTDVAIDDNKLTISLAYAFGNTDKAYIDSVENYVVTVNGVQVPCTALVDPAIDAFIECSTDEINYRLFVPDTTEEKVPLIVWLHGGGETGTDNRAQIAANMVTNWATPESQAYFGGAAYILAPQAIGGHEPEKEMKAITDVIAKYGNIDTNRIYIGGCSMGGGGTVSMITAYPDFFAAAFPICPAGTLSEEAATALAANGMPVYFIHAINDGTISVESSLVGYEHMIAAGGTVHLTLFDRVRCDGVPDEIADQLGHWSWTYVHRNFDCLGDDYDGANYHPGEYTFTGTDEITLYDGAEFDYSALDSSTEGFSVLDSTTWKIYKGEPYDPSLVTTKTENVEATGVSTAPSDLGYDSFFAWLAAQSK